MINYPSSLDNNSTLFLVVNNKRTTLAADISASDLTIPVATTSGFPTQGFITILTGLDITKAEAIRYGSIGPTQFNATERGAGGTIALPHGSSNNVDFTIVADHHNALKDAVIALETFVGVSGSENFLRTNPITGATTVSGLLTVQKPNTPNSFVLIDPNGSITVASGSSTNLTRIQDHFISTGLITTSGSITAGGPIIAPSGIITNLGGTNATFTSYFGSSATLNTISGSIGQFGGQLSAQTVFAPTITGVSGRFSDGLSSQSITSNSGTITNLGGSNSTFSNYFGDNVRATTVSGNNAMFANTVQAQRGEFSSGLTVSGVPVPLQGGSGGGVSSLNGLTGSLTIAGSNGNNISVGGSTINVAGFHNEFVAVSSTVNSQIQNVILPALPTKGTKTFITPVVDRFGGSRRINESFNNRSLVRKLKISPTATGVNSFIIQFYTKDSFDFNDLLEYEATSSGIYVDNELWFHEDADLTNELHMEITNTSSFDSTFQVELKFERFR